MQKKYFLLVFVYGLLCNHKLCAQGWEKVYKDIYAYDISMWGIGTQKTQVTSDGGCIWLGYQYDATLTYAQMHVVKTNSAGTILWNRVFDCGIHALPICVVETPGGYLVGGGKYNPLVGCLLKLDKQGNLLSSKEYSASTYIGMIQKVPNGFVLAGNCNSGIFLSRVDTNGNVIWARQYTAANLTPQSMTPVGNNGFLLVAKVASYTYGMGDVCQMIRVDSLGNVLWARSYTYSNSYDIRCVKETPSGDLILGGNVLMRTDMNGNIIWVKVMNTNMSHIYDIQNTADGGFAAITGGYWNIDGISLVKLTGQGLVQWVQTFGSDHDQAGNLTVTADQGFLLSGYHVDNDNHFSGVYLIKTDSLGQSGCNVKPKMVPGNQPYPSLCVTNNISCAFTGSSVASNANFTQLSQPITTIDPCCYAKPNIQSVDYYPCQGDSIHYMVTGAPHYAWYNGDTSNAIITKDTVVHVKATNTCGSFYDTLIIHPGYVPVFTCHLNKSSLCRGDSVKLDLQGNAPYYSCSGEGIRKVSATQYYLHPTGVTTYTAYGYTGYYGPGCGSVQSFSIQVGPDKPVITQHADTLVSSSLINNQWLLNGSLIPAATSPAYIATAAGNYQVKVTSGCSNISDALAYVPDTIKYIRTAWQKMIVGPGWGETGIDIIAAHDSGFVLVSNSQGQGQDINLVKTDKQGNVIWSTRTGGTGIDQLFAIIKIAGGYAGVGTTTSYGNGAGDVLLLKFDLNGQVTWSKSYGDWNNQQGWAIRQTADGGFIIAGQSTDPHSYHVDQGGWLVDTDDLLLLKTDSVGNLQWSKIFDTGHDEKGKGVYSEANGNYMISGTYADGNGHSQAYLLKTDAGGNLLWSKAIGSSYFISPTSLIATPDNNYMMCGGASGNANILKVDTGGNVLWSKTSQVHSWGNSLAVTADSNVVFTSGGGYTTAALTKIDLNGSLVWSTKFGLGTEYISKVLALADGSFAMTGGINLVSSYYSAGTQHIDLLNVDKDGMTNCNDTFNPAFVNETYTYTPHTTTVSNLGAQFSGSLNNNPTTFAAVEVCRSLGEIKPVAVKENTKAFWLNVYPNPSEGVVTLDFSPATPVLGVRVFDISGRCIFNNQHPLSPGYKIDLSTAGRGVYFVEISTKNQVAVRKIILH